MRRVIDRGAARQERAGLKIVLGLVVAFLVPVLLMASSRQGVQTTEHFAATSTLRPGEWAAFCAHDDRPVCGQVTRPDGAVLWRTFPNACFARQAGATVVAPAPCSEQMIRGSWQATWPVWR